MNRAGDDAYRRDVGARSYKWAVSPPPGGGKERR